MTPVTYWAPPDGAPEPCIVIATHMDKAWISLGNGDQHLVSRLRIVTDENPGAFIVGAYYKTEDNPIWVYKVEALYAERVTVSCWRREVEGDPIAGTTIRIKNRGNYERVWV